MPIPPDKLKQLRALLQHDDSDVRAQGRELLVTLAAPIDALRGLNLSRLAISRCDLSGRDLTGTNLRGTTLHGVNLTDTDLTDAILDETALSSTCLAGAILVRTSMRGARLSRVDLTGARLDGVRLHDATVRCELPDDAVVILNNRTGPHRPWMERAVCLAPGAHLPGVDLSGRELTRVKLEDATLTGANLSGARLRKARLSHSDLRGADLSGAMLSRAQLQHAWLQGADLSGANLSVADLSNADLTGADLTGAKLSGACLVGATLTDAILTGAVMDGVRQGTPPAAPPPADAEARLLALLDDPEWRIRRVALIYALRYGDRMWALSAAQAVPAQHSAPMATLLLQSAARYTTAELSVLPSNFHHRSLILAVAEVAEAQTEAQAIRRVLHYIGVRRFRSELLLHAVPAPFSDAVRSAITRRGIRPSEFGNIDTGTWEHFEPIAPPPMLDRSTLQAALSDPSHPRHGSAFRTLCRIRLIDHPTRALMMTAARTAGEHHVAQLLDMLCSLQPDNALWSLLVEQLSRPDYAGAAAARGLITIAVNHPERVEAVLEQLTPLTGLPNRDPRAWIALCGAFRLLQTDPTLLTQHLSLFKQLSAGLGGRGQALHTLTGQAVFSLDAHRLPAILPSLWRMTGTEWITLLATTPAPVLPHLEAALRPPWGLRARIALRIIAKMGPPAAPLLPLIRNRLLAPLPEVQCAAAQALGAIGDPAALPWLAGASLTPIGKLRRLCAEAMVKIRHADSR